MLHLKPLGTGGPSMPGQHTAQHGCSSLVQLLPELRPAIPVYCNSSWAARHIQRCCGQCWLSSLDAAPHVSLLIMLRSIHISWYATPPLSRQGEHVAGMSQNTLKKCAHVVRQHQFTCPEQSAPASKKPGLVEHFIYRGIGTSALQNCLIAS